MNQVECYLLMNRITGIPVVGESEAIPFIAQVEISDWSWNLSPPEQEGKKNAAAGGAGAQGTEAAKSPEEIAEAMKKQLTTIRDDLLPKALDKMKEQVGDGKIDPFKALGQDQRKSKVDEIFKSVAAGIKTDDTDDDKSMEITFSKQTDFATAQMLNCMKAGEVFPLSILTVFHRSINSPLTLAINLHKMRLTKYDLSVESTDTLTEMKETWTAEFRAFDYVYQNRPPAGMPKGITQAPAVLATQGKVLPFVMLTRKKRGSLF